MKTPDLLQEFTHKANRLTQRRLFDKFREFQSRSWDRGELDLFRSIIHCWVEVALCISLPVKPARSPARRTALRRRVMAVISELGTVFDLGNAGNHEAVRREMRRLEMAVRRAVQALEKPDANDDEKKAILGEAYNGLLTTQQAAQVLRLEANTVIQHIRSGLIKAERVGRMFLIPVDEVEKYEKIRRSRGRPRRSADSRTVDEVPREPHCE